MTIFYLLLSTKIRQIVFCLIRCQLVFVLLIMEIVSKTIEHLRITHIFLDTKLLKILATILVFVLTYHLIVEFTFFLIIHCTQCLKTRAPLGYAAYSSLRVLRKVCIIQFARNTVKIDGLRLNLGFSSSLSK